MSTFVPEGYRLFSEVFQQIKECPDGAQLLRKKLYGGAVEAGISDPKEGPKKLPQSWWGVEENWTKAAGSGTGAYKYRRLHPILDRPDGEYRFSRETGRIEWVPRALTIFHGALFVSASDIDRTFPPEEQGTAAPTTKRGGRPPLPCKPAVMKKALKWLDDEGDQPQADIVRFMADACGELDESPGETTLKTWAGEASAEFRRRSESGER